LPFIHLDYNQNTKLKIEKIPLTLVKEVFAFKNNLALYYALNSENLNKGMSVKFFFVFIGNLVILLCYENAKKSSCPQSI
jgi:hypothetical protein